MTQPTLFSESDAGTVLRSAVLSDCGRYRYRLTRLWDARLPFAAWVMLNPSTADHRQDDPTIRRCIGFARSWGCGGIVVANLFALRSTDPAGLSVVPDPVGPENDAHLLAVARSSRPVVAAWGAHGSLFGRAKAVLAMLRAAVVELQCLGVTKGGFPRHPLRLAGTTDLVSFVA